MPVDSDRRPGGGGFWRFVKVVDFALEAGAGPAGAIEPDVGHRIAMTVETYVYRWYAKTRDVAIRAFARKVEKLREELFDGCSLPVVDLYRFLVKRGRRDIFVDPRRGK